LLIGDLEEFLLDLVYLGQFLLKPLLFLLLLFKNVFLLLLKFYVMLDELLHLRLVLLLDLLVLLEGNLSLFSFFLLELSSEFLFFFKSVFDLLFFLRSLGNKFLGMLNFLSVIFKKLLLFSEDLLLFINLFLDAKNMLFLVNGSLLRSFSQCMLCNKVSLSHLLSFVNELLSFLLLLLSFHLEGFLLVLCHLLLGLNLFFFLLGLFKLFLEFSHILENFLVGLSLRLSKRLGVVWLYILDIQDILRFSLNK
jgi:hypothetical protein